tara:strand:- start:13923 stop:14726 length:804 start_codon:yes stop_codon:yes gene_type:complete
MKERFLEHNIGIDEYITGNRFIDICEESSVTFCKTDYLPMYNKTNHKVFVTHNSDYHIDQQKYELGPNVNCWYAQNKDFDAPNLHSIPIGLENMRLRTSHTAANGRYSSEISGAQAKASLINKINDLCFQKNKMVYMNFNIRTYPKERSHVWNCFCDKDWVTRTENLTMERFYMDLASHKFVLSPRGNGIDCHRTWEALYLRTIPIVKRSINMKEFEDLPIFFVDDWENICYNKLQEFYDKVENTLYDLSKMKISYWRNVINEKLLV